MTPSVSHSDVLIVGAGSAGSVVAEQLSADSNCVVTVLEAGVGLADPGLFSQTANGLQLPIGAASPLVQRYETELSGHPVRRIPIVRGATVGGSGAVNGGYFCRGLPSDFEGFGIPGWGWGDVISHFRAIEHDLDFHGPSHGDSGPIPVRRVSERVGVTAAFASAAENAGVSWIPDLNDAECRPVISAGMGAVPLNIVDGLRTGSGAGYLLPALARKNLTLLERTRAVRLHISTGRAVGVDVFGPGGLKTVTSDRIVLCAGAIESAHLLMLSGMGDESTLRTAGLDVVVPLPVGMGFSDHPELVLPVDWAAAGGRPVLEMILITSEGLEIRPYTSGFGTMVGEGVAGQPDWPHIGVALMQPQARGRITLVSADPRIPPRIEHHYDSAPHDIEVLQHGVELVRDLVGATARVGQSIWSTSQHLCGTTPMGSEQDVRAVLDHRCRVRGVEGLWVIDGSVLPAITSRGPYATIVMIGHRAAEFVFGG